MKKVKLGAGLLTVLFAVTTHGQIGVFKSSLSNNENGGAVIEGASSNGFSLVYNVAQTDCRAITEADVGKRILTEGSAAVLSFKVSSTQLSDTSSGGLGWGFDFGNSVIFCTAATGAPKYTFHQHRYDVQKGFPFTPGVAAGSWMASGRTMPDEAAFLKAGNSVTIVTTLKRVKGDKYEMTVTWGGQTYKSSFVFAGDHSVDSIFIRSGEHSQSAFKPGDNYTVSDVSLEMIPSDAAAVVVG